MLSNKRHKNLVQQAYRGRSVSSLSRDDHHLRLFVHKLLAADVLLIEDLEKIGAQGARNRFDASDTTIRRITAAFSLMGLSFA